MKLARRNANDVWQTTCGGVAWRVIIFLICRLCVADRGNQIERFLNSMRNAR